MQTQQKYSLVLVEDDELLLENYTEILSDEGYQVSGFDNRREAYELIKRQQPDLVILDIGLDNDKNGGIILCKQLRQLFPRLPIIFLTSHSSESDRVQGLKCEVEDYLTKNVSTDFLLVRIKTLLKRIHSLTTDSGEVASNFIHRGDLTLDINAGQAFWKNQRLDITLKQYQMLQELVLVPGQAKSSSKLMSVANMVVEPNTIAANIKSMRNQFKKIDPGFSFIKAEYGAGYRWLDSKPS